MPTDIKCLRIKSPVTVVDFEIQEIHCRVTDTDLLGKWENIPSSGRIQNLEIVADTDFVLSQEVITVTDTDTDADFNDLELDMGETQSRRRANVTDE